MIAQDFEVSLHKAFMDAREKRHEFITVEHLVLALLDNPSASEVLRACAGNIEELRKLFTEFINGTPPVTGDEVDTQPTLGFQRVIQRAILHVQSSGKKEVTGADVLVAIFGEQDSQAVYFLQQKGVRRSDVINYLSKQEDVTRIFRMTDSGGVERVIVKDATAQDQAAVALIQQQLQHKAEAFRRGDYSDPGSPHDADMPGVKDLQAGAAHIRVAWSPLPTGAEITFETTERHLLTAIHRWFGAQLSKHGADATSE